MKFIVSLAVAVTLGHTATAWPNNVTGFSAGSAESIQNLKSKIKNVVILVMENRSLDNLLGGQKLPGLDNPIQNGPFCNPLNISQGGSESVCSDAADFNSILEDPDHSVSGNNLEFYGSYLPDNQMIQSGALTPNMSGFITEQITHYSLNASTTTLATQVMHYYTEEEVPVFTDLCKNSIVFNNWHSDHPGVSLIPPDITSIPLICHRRLSLPTPTDYLSPLAPLPARVPTISISTS